MPDVYDAAKAHGDTAALQRRAITALVGVATTLDTCGLDADAALVLMLIAELDADAAVHERLALAPFEPTPPPGPLPSRGPRRTELYPLRK